MNCVEMLLGEVDRELRPRSAILDVGCGTGRFTRQLAHHLSAATEIVGVDPDKDSIDEARRETDDRRVRYQIRDAAALAFEDARFDLVTISNALHHVPDPAQVLGELERVLRPGGTLLVVEVVSDGLSKAQEAARAVHHFKSAVDRSRGLSHRETYTRAEVRELVTARANATIVPIGECAVDDTEPEGEPADDSIAFLTEYLEHAAPDKRSELGEQARAALVLLAESGIAPPARLAVWARKRSE